jgi:catechol 2,3-dioxygenase-like lactoylglutathione lyase family enzyme
MLTKGYLHQIHPVLPVKDVVEALDFYANRLGFRIGFADDPKNPKYAGVLRDGIEIHLQWHDATAWEAEVDRPMLRIVTQNIQELYQEYAEKDVFHSHTLLKNTAWGTKEFAFYDPFKNGLTFYKDTE